MPNSGSWWWTGRPGVLQSMGSQRVGHDWATELTELMRVRAPRWDWCLYKSRKRHHSFCSWPCEDTARRQTFPSQEEGSHQNAGSVSNLILDLWEMPRHFHCLSHPVYGILFQQPKLTKTNLFSDFEYFCINKKTICFAVCRQYCGYFLSQCFEIWTWESPEEWLDLWTSLS